MATPELPTTPATTWSDVRGFYRWLGDAGWQIDAMLALVDAITARGYAPYLKPATSHALLRIWTTDPAIVGREELSIDPQPDGSLWFEYREERHLDPAWTARATTTDCVAVLERFLFRRARWLR